MFTTMEFSFKRFLELQDSNPNIQSSMARYLGVDPSAFDKLGGNYLPNASVDHIEYNGLHLKIVDTIKDDEGHVVRAKLKIEKMPGTVASSRNEKDKFFLPDDLQVGKEFYVGKEDYMKLMSPTITNTPPPMPGMM